MLSHYAPPLISCKRLQRRVMDKDQETAYMATDILSRMLGFSEHEVTRMYEGKVVHRTAPFTEPQVEAANP